MKLIARKPCSFGGRQFFIGNEIPAEFVLNPKGQEEMGVLSMVNDDGTAAPTSAVIEPTGERNITINITSDAGDMPLNVTETGLQAIFTILTGNVSEAEEIIGQITDGDALILLHMADRRKTVQEAAEARATALSTNENAGEQ